MKRFILDFILSKQLTAGPKAREDINRILSNKGFIIKKLVISNSAIIKSIISLICVPLSIATKSIVIIQYPLGNLFISNWIIHILKIKRCSICVIIHDLESLRRHGQISDMETKNLQMANQVVVHTERMKALLVKAGINAGEMSVIQLFDYLVDKDEMSQTIDDACIFAGNLNKSRFLSQIKTISWPFRLYGDNKNIEGIFSDQVSYGGRFLPSDLSLLNGKWGLVWDGDTIDNCSEYLGNYLRYNAPHKLSLYLSAGIPVIVWKESAESDFIIEKGVGISVDSLRHLDDVLRIVSIGDYLRMKKNVFDISLQLRTGQNILRVTNALHS